MRTPKLSQSKKPQKSRIRKKNYKTIMLALKNNTINRPDVTLDNLSKLIRHSKSKQTERRGSWKVLPKDSCEIYKARRKRHQNEETDETANEFSDDSQHEISKRDRKKPRKKSPKKRQRESRKKYKPSPRNNKRRK